MREKMNMNDDHIPQVALKVCELCFRKLHCRGRISTQCECPCRELSDPSEVMTTHQWNERQVKEAGIRARMRDVEGKVIQ
jgi:hypothetical protein